MRAKRPLKMDENFAWKSSIRKAILRVNSSETFVRTSYFETVTAQKPSASFFT